jgi:hypothetical protein
MTTEIHTTLADSPRGAPAPTRRPAKVRRAIRRTATLNRAVLVTKTAREVPHGD